MVRGCASATTVASAATTTATASTSGGAAALYLHGSSCFSPFGVVEQAAHQYDDRLLCFPDPFETRREVVVEELHDLYRPFFPKSQPLSPRTIPISSLSVIGTHQIQQAQKQDPPSSKQSHANSVASTVHSQSPRSKRR